ncbi:MAG TPA: hypothetical protein VFQ16_00185 [Burkholderiaceae bacterium]|nr:hypothetical protein [Burkholderiaceae bacterium]
MALMAVTLAAALVSALMLLCTGDAHAQGAKVKPYALAASAVVKPAPLAPKPAAIALTPAVAGRLTYTPLNAASMAPISRDVEQQVQRALGRERLQIKTFSGVVQAPPAVPGAPAPRFVPAAFVDDPLRYDAQRNQYLGRIAVGLMPVDDGSRSGTLPEAVQFQVIGDVQSDPDSVPVGGASPPFKTIVVAARDPRAGVSLRVANSLSRDPVVLELPVVRALLRLSGPSRLQGFGVDTADFTIEASDGAASRNLPVALAIDRGSVQPNQVTLGPDGTAQVRVRSESIGRARLTAGGSHLEEGSSVLEYEAPWRALGACVLGGTVGGVLRQGGGRRMSGRRRALEVGLAVLCGLLVWALSVLGVNLLAVELPAHGGEVLAAVVGALGALSGVKLLDKISPAP